MLATVLQLGYPDSLSSIGHLNFYRSSFEMKTEQQLYHWKKHVSLKFHSFQASFFKKLIIMEIVCAFILKHLVYMHVQVNLLKIHVVEMHKRLEKNLIWFIIGNKHICVNNFTNISQGTRSTVLFTCLVSMSQLLRWQQLHGN